MNLTQEQREEIEKMAYRLILPGLIAINIGVDETDFLAELRTPGHRSADGFLPGPSSSDGRTPGVTHQVGRQWQQPGTAGAYQVHQIATAVS